MTLDIFALCTAAESGNVHIDECPELWHALVARGCVPYEFGSSTGPMVNESVHLRIGRLDIWSSRRRSLTREERLARIAAVTAAMEEGPAGDPYRETREKDELLDKGAA